MLAPTLAPRSTTTRRPPPLALVVDDDEAMRSLLGEALADAGYEVVELADGEEALPWQAFDPGADSFVFEVDLLVTDVRMARCDGLELLGAVRATGRMIPVILISAFADDALRRQAERLGAAAVLAKPFSLDELLGLCAELCPVSP